MRAAVPAPLATASNALGFDLWSRLRSMPGNLVFSPASLSTALAMAWAGAAGETAAEMQRVLRLDVDPEAAMTAWSELAAALQAPPRSLVLRITDRITRRFRQHHGHGPSRSLVLRIANRLFGEQSFRFDAVYFNRTPAAFGAPLEGVDFAKAPERARARINRWVEGQTEHRIKDLLPSISSSTRLVLVNAIYFLADWEAPFARRSTTEQPFAIAPGATRPAMLMRRRGVYRMAKADGVAVLELPYAGGDASMLVLLPDQVDGLPAVERSLDGARLAAWTRALAEQDLLVWLPRFVVDPVAMPLRDQLQALGMAQAFDPERADFTRIANPPAPADRLFLGGVFHKAFVRVDEEGTEAAAATAIALAGAVQRHPVSEFKADHPFLFFIIDRASSLVLFMGRVAEPKAP